MSWVISIVIIAYGVYGIIKPEKMINPKSAMIENEGDKKKILKKNRILAIFMLICGLVILFCDIMLYIK